MAAQEVLLELLVGQQVQDPEGRSIGRIEEVRAERRDDAWWVREYLVGPTALLERLSAGSLVRGLLRRVRGSPLPTGYRVPWQELDVSDPQHLRLRCPRSQLEALSLDEDHPV